MQTHNGDCDCGKDAETLARGTVDKVRGLSAQLHQSRHHGWAKVALYAALARATPDSDTTNENHLALAILEVYAQLLDRLAYYQDRTASEAYLTTARERVSLRDHARLVDYELRSGLTMSTQIVFEVDAAPRASEILTLPAGTLVESTDPEKPARTFQTLEEIECRRAWNSLRPRRSPMDKSMGQSGLTLDTKIDPLPPGRLMLVTGLDAVTGEEVAEAAILETAVETDDSSKLYFESPLHHRYSDETLLLHANVVAATHGETIVEVLGDGDESLPRQSFPLTRRPLSSDGESVIDVRISGVRWHEVPNLLDRGARDRVFVIEVADDGKATIAFGDGTRGARLPTGTRNVVATYRTGVGAEGDVNASETSNPIPAESGMDPPAAPHL